jgi:hypothetical protein
VPPASAAAAAAATASAREAQQGRVVHEPPVVEQPAAAPTPTVEDDDAPPADAPLPLGDDEFPDEILAVVCSFLDLRELGRLACTARRFVEPAFTEPGGGSGSVGGAKLSPIEEGARLRLAATMAGGGGGGGASDGVAPVRLEDETWVRAMWRVHPWYLLAGEAHRQRSAVCAEHPMVAGAHYVEMTLLEEGRYGANVGVVGQGFDAASGGTAGQSREGWLLGTEYGRLVHARRPSNWQGMPQYDKIKQGDVVGLLLDLGQRTLSVYLNGEWRGVMVAPGMKNRDGDATAALAGQLRWGVDMYAGASVRIERRPAPGPVPSAEEVAAAVAWNEANYNKL